MSDRVSQMEKILQERGMDILFARVASNLMKKGNIDEAVNICENGLKKFPSYAQAHYVLANCYLKMKKQEEAKNELERTLKLDPNHLRALYLLADIHKNLGMEAAYKEKLQKLHVLDPLNQALSLQVKKLGWHIPWPKNETGDASGDKKDHDDSKFEKVDLSQFNNRDDDFTTIISGKKPSEEETFTEPSAAEEVAGAGDLDDEPVSPDFEDLDELKFDEEADSGDGNKERWIGSSEGEDITEIMIAKPDEPETEAADPRAAQGAELKTGDGIADEHEEAGEILTQPKIVSQTLGEILVSQKKYTQALQVFELLKEQHPENKSLEKKISFLKKIIALEQKH